MQWFGINLHCNIAITRITPVCFAFVVGGLATMSFTNGENAKPLSDSTLAAKYGFRSLFTNNHFDATKPYAAQLNPRAVSFV